MSNTQHLIKYRDSFVGYFEYGYGEHTCLVRGKK